MKVIIKFFKKLVLVVFFINILNVNAEDQIKLGLLTPLTGEHSEIGKSIIQSVRMGINKINNNNILIISQSGAGISVNG